MRTRQKARWLGLVAVLALLAGLLAAAPAQAERWRAPDLRADVDRDGNVSFVGAGDERGENTWTASRGALFLPNLDDDQRRCRVTEDQMNAFDIAVDRELAACDDAADSVVNGPMDAADLAPLKIAPLREASDRATGRLSVEAGRENQVRVFVQRQGELVPLLPETTGAISAAELRTGVTLAVEGRDVVRDSRAWDGTVTVTLDVADGPHDGSDQVQLKVAPLMVQNDLQRVDTVLAGRPGTGPGFGLDGESASTGHGDFPNDWEPFAASLTAAAKQAKLPNPEPRFIAGSSLWWRDMWWQDIFEPATVSMPKRGGAQVMRIAIRSANQWEFDDDGMPVRSLRPAGRQLFRDLRGPGVGVVQQFADDVKPLREDLLNMGGNLESVPAYGKFRNGRLVYGSHPKRQPDQSFIRLFESQGQQPPIVIDVSWLMVGHADETTHVIPARNSRGWTLMVADPRLAEQALQDARRQGAGGSKLLEGTRSERQPTVDQVLGDSELLKQNAEAAKHIDDQLAVLLTETGLEAEELVRVPVLFEYHRADEQMYGYRALTPGIPNGLSLTAKNFAAPDPHGPKVNGSDLFKSMTEAALRRNAVTVRWVEAFGWAHQGGGEVHCATNAWRDTRSTDSWWRAG